MLNIKKNNFENVEIWLNLQKIKWIIRRIYLIEDIHHIEDIGGDENIE